MTDEKMQVAHLYKRSKRGFVYYQSMDIPYGYGEIRIPAMAILPEPTFVPAQMFTRFIKVKGGILDTEDSPQIFIEI